MEPSTRRPATLAALALALLGLATRLPGLADPPRVVWDEYFFAFFSSRYLVGEHYLDIHPPLGKMLMAAALRTAGAHPPGAFELEAPYPPGYPYWAGRLVPALAGALLPLAAWALARALGARVRSAFLAGLLVVLETGLLVESRYQLIDVLVPLFALLAAAAAVRHLRGGGWPWWIAACLAGGCAASTKWTGAGVLLAMGLWTLFALPPRRLVARLALLAVVPAAVYLGCFALHFRLLPRFGGGWNYDLSPAYRASLEGGDVDGHQARDAGHQARDAGIEPLGFWGKLAEAHRWAWRANATTVREHPSGSRWFVWPMPGSEVVLRGPVASGDRPIVLLPNPAVVTFGTTSLVVALVLLARRKLPREATMLVVLHLANWLPFAAISRVMFVYHYSTALLASTICGVLLLEDRVPPWLAACVPALAIGGFALVAPLAYGFAAPAWWGAVVPGVTVLGAVLVARRRM